MDEQNNGGNMEEMGGKNIEDKSMGGAIGAIIIVAILVIGGVYFINRGGDDVAVVETYRLKKLLHYLTKQQQH